MLRQLLVITSLALAAQLAHAAEAGKIIFVAGKANIADRAVVLNTAVQEGDMLSTGADGFIYVKTIDNGLFILRPNTQARIAAYHVDAKDPANTRIKLELLSGVARSRSGEAVKLARQNFRFNTPVAAIGVRGTDFTVFTDQDTSRVAVISGGIVVSGFVGGCRPEGSGPCEGNASRELSATQRGQLLQVQRGQASPQLIQGGALAPDQASPPRTDEPIGKNGGVNGPSNLAAGEANLDAKKSESLNHINAQLPTAPLPPPVVTTPPVVEVSPPPVTPTLPPVTPPETTPVVQVPERAIVWGRWQPLLDQAATVDMSTESAAKSKLLSVQGNFALYRRPGPDYVPLEHGNVAFSLKESEAYIYNDDRVKPTLRAQVQNGLLSVDFGKSSFATSFDLLSQGETFKLQSQGALGKDGRLYGNSQFSYPTNMSVDGALSNEKNGTTAAYIFQGRLDATRSANGSTYWGTVK